jgi:hypothetical protein
MVQGFVFAQKADQPGTKENNDPSTSVPTDSAARAGFTFASHSRDFLGTTFYIHIFGAQNLMILRALFEPWGEF